MDTWEKQMTDLTYQKGTCLTSRSTGSPINPAPSELYVRRKKIKAEQFDFILNRIMKQAEALYEDWPIAA